MRQQPARSSTRSSARPGRSRPGRAPHSRPWPAAPSWRPGSEARTQLNWSQRSPWSRAASSCCSRVFRLGWIARFLSKAVITGFLAGAAIDVTIGELSKLTGTSSSGDSAWRELWTWLQGLDEIHWSTLVVGLVSLGVILGLRFTAPAGPRRARAGGRRPGRVGALRPRRARRGPRRSRSPGAPEPGAARLGPRPDASVDDRHRVGRPAPDRFLPDRRRRTSVRDAAPVPHRRQPGIGRSGDGERRGRASSRACRSRRVSPRAR